MAFASSDAARLAHDFHRSRQKERAWIPRAIRLQLCHRFDKTSGEGVQRNFGVDCQSGCSRIDEDTLGKLLQLMTKIVHPREGDLKPRGGVVRAVADRSIRPCA